MLICPHKLPRELKWHCIMVVVSGLNPQFKASQPDEKVNNNRFILIHTKVATYALPKRDILFSREAHSSMISVLPQLKKRSTVLSHILNLKQFHYFHKLPISFSDSSKYISETRVLIPVRKWCAFWSCTSKWNTCTIRLPSPLLRQKNIISLNVKWIPQKVWRNAKVTS